MCAGKLSDIVSSCYKLIILHRTDTESSSVSPESGETFIFACVLGQYMIGAMFQSMED